jgi:hypothetical protein
MNAATCLNVPPLAQWDDSSYRACELCDHGRHDDAGLSCYCSAAVAPLRWQSVAIVRARYAACGPEARHMRVDGQPL